MKALRIVALVILILALAGGGVVWFSLQNQQELVGVVLGMIHEQTGLEIVPKNSWISFDSHLMVVLEAPRVSLNGRPVATLKEVRAEISYQRLLLSHGLPLHSLELVEARVALPPSSSASAPSLAVLLESLGPGAVASLQKMAGHLQRVTKQLWIENSAAEDPNGPFLQNIHLSAVRVGLLFRRLIVRASAEVRVTPSLWVPLFVQAKLDLKKRRRARPPLLIDARLNELPLHFTARNFAFKGLASISTQCQLSADGALSVSSDTTVLHVEIGRSTAPKLAALPGTWQLDAKVALSSQLVKVQSASFSINGTRFVTASGSLGLPLSTSAPVKLQAATAPVPLPAVRNTVAGLGLLNAAPAGILNGLKSGTVTIRSAVLDTNLGVLTNWQVSALRRRLQLAGELKGVSFSPPARWAMAQARVTDAAITLQGDSLQMRQGTAEVAGAEVGSMKATFNLSGFPDAVSYEASAAGRVDFGKFYSMVAQSLPRRVTARLKGLGGYSRFDVSASGMLRASQWQAPDKYHVVLAPSSMEVNVKGSPSALLLSSGTVAISERGIKFDNLSAEVAAKDGVADPGAGSAVIRGGVELVHGGPRFEHLAVDVHRVRAERWLPLLAVPGELSINGSVGGSLELNGMAESASNLRISGNLTVGRAEIKTGFLRFPLVVDSVAVVLSGRQARASIPAARINGDSLRIELAIDDLSHPVLRIDGDAQTLDLTDFKFFRAPWRSAAPSTAVPPLPIYGHAKVQTALVGALVLNKASADYRYDHGDWKVSNLKASVAGGHLKVQVQGRQRDDWIHIQGQGTGLEVGTLFLMSNPGGEPPLVGTLDAVANVRADTNANFFQTLEGKVAAVLKNGRLNRMTVLSRILALIDLKTWLSARVPDPRAHGLPFDTLSGTATGKKGTFHTDNTRLQGPVMHLSAEGDINAGDRTMDLDVEAVPFSTFSWLVSKIPLVGEHVAGGSKDLFAGYFKVKGPLSNPDVSVMPITSVAKFAAKVIALPINIISPDTVR